MALNIVLMEPEIPQNTGNIARTCVVTNTRLHIIKPMGFKLDESRIRRAGLDYWQYLQLDVYESIQDLWDKYPNGEFYYFSTKAQKRFDKAEYGDNCFLVFGKETAGLPEWVLSANKERCVRIPMYEEHRCLNLSNAVCAALYTAMAKHDYFDLA